MKIYHIKNQNSEEWNVVKDFINKRIIGFQKELETDYDDRKSNVLRGKISFAREVLRLGEKKITMDEIETVDYE